MIPCVLPSSKKTRCAPTAFTSAGVRSLLQNCCVSSSPLPFPSPSPSQRQVCVLDWCALDSVRGRVWTAHTATATRGYQWVALSPASKRKLVLHTSRRGLKNVYIPAGVQTRVKQSRRRLKHVGDVSVFVQSYQWGLLMVYQWAFVAVRVSGSCRGLSRAPHAWAVLAQGRSFVNPWWVPLSA